MTLFELYISKYYVYNALFIRLFYNALFIDDLNIIKI